MKTPSTRNWAALDGIRGYAVALVSLTHFVASYATWFRGLDVERATYWSVASPSERLLLWLFLSMQSLYILLTISGYMVCRMVMRPSYPGYLRFLLARGARIYPPLIFSLIFAVVVYHLFGQSLDLSLRNIAYNVLTLNGVFEITGQPFNYPSWSLFYEVVYCILIPVLVAISSRARRATLTLFALWIPMLLCLAVFEFSGWILFAPFIVGSLLAQVDDQRLIAAAARIPTWSVIAAYAVVAALPSSWAPIPVLAANGLQFAPSYMIFIVLACLMSCALLVKAVYAEGVIQRFFALRPLEYLGKTSYSFYLLHAPLIFVVLGSFSAFAARWSEAGTAGHFFVLLVIFWCLCISAATIGFYVVEIWYFRSALSSRSGKRSTQPPKANKLSAVPVPATSSASDISSDQLPVRSDASDPAASTTERAAN